MSTKDICNLNSLKAVKLIKVDFLQTSITEKPYKNIIMEMHIQEQAISKTIVLNFVRRCYCGLVGLVSLCYCAFAVVSCIQNIYWSVICGPQSFFWQVLCGTESFFWWLFCGPNIFSCECFVGPIFFFSWVLFGPEKFALRLKIFFRD